MICTKTLDLIDECFDQHDDAITANTTLIEEVLVRLERLEKIVRSMWRVNLVDEPEVARDEAEDRCEAKPGFVRVLVLDDECEEPVVRCRDRYRGLRLRGA